MYMLLTVWTERGADPGIGTFIANIFVSLMFYFTVDDIAVIRDCKIYRMLQRSSYIVRGPGHGQKITTTWPIDINFFGLNDT